MKIKWPSRSTTHGAFTILELVVVIVIMAILAGSVIPALTGMDDARGAAAAQEIQRRLQFCRQNALAVGEATGLRITIKTGEIEMLSKRPGGIAQAARDPLGQLSAPWYLPRAYRGLAISSFVHTDGSKGDGTIWFSFEGEPQTRDGDGESPASAVQDAVITLNNGRTITVRRLSGLVEQE
ncbi:MAG: type II secretion system protein [Phycisphaerales bacterium]|nr:type II secretion system protein [Phycisphaerales bacterium]